MRRRLHASRHKLGLARAADSRGALVGRVDVRAQARAERYGDARRSGVYRVGDAAVLRAAAVEAGRRLMELCAGALANGGGETLRLDDASLVVLMDGAPAIGPEHLTLLGKLEARASDAREKGEIVFAVMVDPRGALQRPRLYKERE